MTLRLSVQKLGRWHFLLGFVRLCLPVPHIVNFRRELREYVEARLGSRFRVGAGAVEGDPMNRRLFLKSMPAGVYAFAHLPMLQTALPKMKITRVRAYAPPNPNPLFNQADTVVTVETDAGITGIGEGGFKDTLEQCAGRLIGQDPQFIERLWQDMSRSFFYPPGREKVHALGALDLALWDIKGKVLNRPVHSLLGGMARNHCECYATGGEWTGRLRTLPLISQRAKSSAPRA